MKKRTLVERVELFLSVYDSAKYIPVHASDLADVPTLQRSREDHQYFCPDCARRVSSQEDVGIACGCGAVLSRNQLRVVTVVSKNFKLPVRVIGTFGQIEFPAIKEDLAA